MSYTHSLVSVHPSVLPSIPSSSSPQHPFRESPYPPGMIFYFLAPDTLVKICAPPSPSTFISIPLCKTRGGLDFSSFPGFHSTHHSKTEAAKILFSNSDLQVTVSYKLEAPWCHTCRVVTIMSKDSGARPPECQILTLPLQAPKLSTSQFLSVIKQR